VRRSEDRADLYAAIAEAKKDMPIVPKVSLNPYFGSKYADLADVVKLIDPHIAKFGLSVGHHPETIDGADMLTTVLRHSSGQEEQSTVALHATKEDPQGFGSALTYARRYVYCAVLGVVADADDDGAAAAETPLRREGPRTQQKKETRTGPGGAKEATESQWKLIIRLANDLGKETPADGLTIAQASELIDKWQDEKKTA
jgi:hypothetical protein